MTDPFQKALHCFRAGRLSEAEAACLQVPGGHPKRFDALHLLGVVRAGAGRHAQAAKALESALRLRNSADVHLALGNVRFAQGRHEEALRGYDAALALRPGFADALYNRGNVLRALGRHREAVVAYDAVLALDPSHADACNNRGNALLDLGEAETAAENYRAALCADPRHAAAALNLGIVLMRLGRPELALAALESAVVLDPGSAEAQFQRAGCLRRLSRPAEALEGYRLAAGLDPGHVDALRQAGLLLQELGRLPEALTALESARALRGDDPDLEVDTGNVLVALHRFEDALACYGRALKRDDAHAPAHNNRGNALSALKRPSEAITAYRAAIAAKPDYADAHVNLGHCLRATRRLAEAEDAYGQALAFVPEYQRAVFGLALVQLSQGRFVPGWRNYEARWHPDNLTSEAQDFARPLWLGDFDLQGKTILLHSEQGLGDTIQFCRYASLVKARGARVVLRVQPPLKTLLASLDGPELVVAVGEPVPDFDVHCPLLSLPLAFGTALETIPGTCPYLSGDPASARGWRERLGPRARPRVGIAWSGNPGHASDHLRSLPLARLAPLFAAEADFFVLQGEVSAEDRAVLGGYPNVIDFGPELGDFARTAALASLMDVVISVDTAVAHLAGAIGRPVWVLLAYSADWRWLQERDGSPWYPSARLLRQPGYGDWEPVIAAAAAALAGLGRP